MSSLEVKSIQKSPEVAPCERTDPDYPRLFSNWPRKNNIPVPLIAETKNGERHVLVIVEFDSMPSVLMYPLPDPLNEKVSLYSIMNAGHSSHDERVIENLSTEAKFHMQLGMLMSDRKYLDYAFWCYQRGVDTAKIVTEMKIGNDRRASAVSIYIDYLTQFANAIYERAVQDKTFKAGVALGVSIAEEAHEVLLQEGQHKDLGHMDTTENLIENFEALALGTSTQSELSPQMLPEVPRAELIQTEVGSELKLKLFDCNVPDELAREFSLLVNAIRPLNEIKKATVISRLIVESVEEPFYLMIFERGVSFLKVQGYPTGEYPHENQTFAQCVGAQIAEALSGGGEVEMSDNTVSALYNEHYHFFRRSICAACAKNQKDYENDIHSALDVLRLVAEYGNEQEQRTALNLACVTVIQPAVSYAGTHIADGCYITAAEILQKNFNDVNEIAVTFGNVKDPNAMVEEAHSIRTTLIGQMLRRFRVQENGIRIVQGILALTEDLIHERYEGMRGHKTELEGLEQLYRAQM